MAGSFFALFDDIATILDDIGIMTKAAAKKTVGILGDDLAVNAHQVSDISAERELAVVWAVAKGSLWNKVILVPLALLLSAFAPAAVHYVLLAGGAYLCFEGAEKILHHVAARRMYPHEKEAPSPDAEDFAALERRKIRGAIKTDFILSTEIVVIALGVLTEMGKPFAEMVFALSVIAFLLTVGVYGTVALIVKMDDIGAGLVRRYEGIADLCGRFLLWVAPKILRALTVIGTIAMLAVGGTIWVEHLPPLHRALHPWLEKIQAELGAVGVYLLEIGVGLLLGLAIVALLLPLWGRLKLSKNTKKI